MSARIFVTALNCMDGRVQLPVINYLINNFNAQFVDMITEPGMVKILALNTDKLKARSIKEKIDISINNHNSKFIAIIAHSNCTGNPVSYDIQKEEIFSSIRNLESEYNNIEIVGLWINENFEVSTLIPF
jgi:carbonic anhydrase